MRNRPKPELTPEFTAKLVEVGQKLVNGENVASAYVGVPERLFGLPPASISTMGYTISNIASLHYYREPRPRRLIDLFVRRPKSEEEQLKRVFGLAFLFIFHGNGHLRQAALEKISGPLNSPFIAASIILRMNDWVSEVRQAALACVQRTFPATGPRVLASAARALLADMAAWQRWGLVEDKLRTLLLRDDVCDLIVADMVAQSAASDIATFRHLLYNPSIDQHLETLVRFAVTPTVRAMAAKVLLSGQAQWQIGWRKAPHDRFERAPHMERVMQSRAISVSPSLSEILPLLAQDPSKLVRCTLLDHIILTKAADPAGVTIAKEFLLSDVRPLKERAQFIARKLASGDWGLTKDI